MKLHLPTILIAATLALCIAFVTSTTSNEKGVDATYVGQSSCVSSGCHGEYANQTYQGSERFFETTHAKSHKVPSSESIIPEHWFRYDSVIAFHDERVGDGGDSLYVKFNLDESSGRYRMQLLTEGPGPDSTEWLEIDYVIGGNSWVERYLVSIGGSYYPLPIQYNLPRYGDRSLGGDFTLVEGEKWYRYDEQLDALVFLSETSELFLNTSWDNLCAGCHISPFTIEARTIEGNTAWSVSWPERESSDSILRSINLSVGCESCHGPASNHVADPGNAEYQRELSPKYWDPTGRSEQWTDRKLDLCVQCHSRHRSSDGVHDYPYDDGGGIQYLPREDLHAFVRDRRSDAKFWSDGVSSSAHHQSGLDYVRSKHYSQHVFPNGCYDCHEVHNTTDEPFMLKRDFYSLEKGEGCVAFGCHSSFANTITRDNEVYNIHSRHRNQHSQCVNCHYTRTSTMRFDGGFEFSDHSDQVIRPLATIMARDEERKEFSGVPNTCAASCHRNGYGDRNGPNSFYETIEGQGMRAPDFGVIDSNEYIWNEESDIVLAESLWVGYKRLYPEFVSSVRSRDATSSDIMTIESVVPNPIRAMATITFSLPKSSDISLEVYDMVGRKLRMLAEGYHRRGLYKHTWSAVDESGRRVSSGTYYIRLSVLGRTVVHPVSVH